MMDSFTHLRQMGYYGTLNEMLERYYADVSGSDTIGEQLDRALDAEMARNFLGITVTGSSIIAVPSGLSASGVPSNQTFLRGDGAWATPPGTGGGGGGPGDDPNAVKLTGDQQIDGIKTFLKPPVGVTKAAVGLSNVDNTSDAN